MLPIVDTGGNVAVVGFLRDLPPPIESFVASKCYGALVRVLRASGPSTVMCAAGAGACGLATGRLGDGLAARRGDCVGQTGRER